MQTTPSLSPTSLIRPGVGFYMDLMTAFELVGAVVLFGAIFIFVLSPRLERQKRRDVFAKLAQSEDDKTVNINCVRALGTSMDDDMKDEYSS